MIAPPYCRVLVPAACSGRLNAGAVAGKRCIHIIELAEPAVQRAARDDSTCHTLSNDR